MRYITIVVCFLSLSLFSQENVRTETSKLEEVKSMIKETIDAHAFDEDSNKRRYKAVFEGDKLRLLIMKGDGSKPINKGLLYDFSNVYKFDRLSLRKKEKAYVNIWLDFLDKENYPKRKKWVKIKLIMKVVGHDKAKIIMDAFKMYNKILVSNKTDK